MLVNRHTVSGAEIVAHFAKEHGLAVIVGERTAGRSLSFGTFQRPYGFRFTVPIGDYVPWSGNRFEHFGVEPDVQCQAGAGRIEEDQELSAAIKVVRSEAKLAQASGKP